MTQESRIPLSRTNLNAKVATHIREEIFAGRMRPGSRLDQDGLAARLGVSKIPVREAIIALEVEGLVVSYPHRGAFVAQVTPDDVRDHFAIFGAVSSMAAARAATELGPDEVAALADVLDRMQAPGAPLDHLNDELHRRINRAGSRRLRSVIGLLATAMPTRFFETTDPSAGDIAHDEHAAIVEAIRDGDAEMAAEVTRRHFERSGAVAVQSLKERGFWTSG